MPDDWFVYSLISASVVLVGVSSYLLYVRSSSRVTASVSKPEENADTREVFKIMYGTQTGTAEKFAKQLATALDTKYGGEAVFKVVDVEDFDQESMGNEKLLMFLLATYGDGEPTDNAIDLDSWLEKAADDVMNGDRDTVLQVRPEHDQIIRP